MPNLRAVLRKSRSAVDIARHTLGWHQSHATLVRDAQRFWDAPPPQIRDIYSHWRSGFSDDATWLAIGRENLEIFQTFARSAQFHMPPKRIVEWGCGGGANAVHFAPLAEAFYGVDITRASLDECERQMKSFRLTNFHPVLIEATSPRAALDQIPHDCDLFVSFYVFEVFPSPEYGMEVLKIAHELLRPGGMAIIHIKYPVGLGTQSRRWGYRFGVSSMTSYRLDDFWELSKQAGFTPHAIHLMPKQPLVQDERYAYVVLVK
jgi:SAM-dependent methyltransferase